jgi:ABC-type uncharacterized transport system permease subunit
VRIAMIGGGYVGLVSGACFAKFGSDGSGWIKIAISFLGKASREQLSENVTAK